jgi:A/G-specific adenine glycosylase
MPVQLGECAGMRTSLADPAPPRKPPAPPSPAETAERLLAWYDRHARVLPWRIGPAERRQGARPDPYRVWLSEIMLQQTTVKAVLPYFAAFARRWPDIETLAAAPESEVMAAWAGLGYYSRARNLIACARVIVSEHGGAFPRRAAELARLPGIGAYTSAAIAAIAFDEKIAVVDGNVERVAARHFAIAEPPPAGKEAVRAALAPLVPAGRPGEFAEALMDLGATICTPKRPACALCTLAAGCLARADGAPEAYPVKAPKRARPVRYGIAFVAVSADGAVLLRRRPPCGLLGGMAEVPGTDWREAPPAAHPRPPLAGEWSRLAVPVSHTFTHFELQLTVQVGRIPSGTPAPPGHWWAPLARLEAAGLPSVMRKAVEAALAAGGATRPRRG